MEMKSEPFRPSYQSVGTKPLIPALKKIDCLAELGECLKTFHKEPKYDFEISPY